MEVEKRRASKTIDEDIWPPRTRMHRLGNRSAIVMHRVVRLCAVPTSDTLDGSPEVRGDNDFRNEVGQPGLLNPIRHFLCHPGFVSLGDALHLEFYQTSALP